MKILAYIVAMIFVFLLFGLVTMLCTGCSAPIPVHIGAPTPPPLPGLTIGVSAEILSPIARAEALPGLSQSAALPPLLYCSNAGTVTVESAPTPFGPWTALATFAATNLPSAFTNHLNQPQQFYRLQLQ